LIDRFQCERRGFVEPTPYGFDFILLPLPFSVRKPFKVWPSQNPRSDAEILTFPFSFSVTFPPLWIGSSHADNPLFLCFVVLFTSAGPQRVRQEWPTGPPARYRLFKDGVPEDRVWPFFPEQCVLGFLPECRQSYLILAAFFFLSPRSLYVINSFCEEGLVSVS